MILQELLDRSEQLASGVAGGPVPQVDRQMTAYTAYPHAVRAVYRQRAASGRHLEDISHEHLIEVVDGEATIPEAVFREFLDRSSLPQVTYGSYLPFEDYSRYRFDTQIEYYAVRGDKFFYSGEVPKRLTSPLDITAASGSITITGSAAGAEVGDRFAVTDVTNGLIIDAMIASINGIINFTMHGKTIAATSSSDPGPTGAIYSTDDDLVVRSVTDAVTTINLRTVTSATAAFTSADVGRRLRVYQDGTLTIVVDSIIHSVDSATQVTLRAQALSSQTGADASIIYSPLILQAVGIPALPTDLDDALTLSPPIAEDVIIKIASVLRGEMALQALIEAGQHAKR